MARTFKALVRAKKVKTPVKLLRVVYLYCGLDKSLREVAGTFTALYESMTAQSVAERLRACGPWVKAMLRQMVPMAAVARLPSGRRFVVIASSIQAPGATGTDHRLHIAMDLVALQCLEVSVSDVHTGETRKHFTFAPGESPWPTWLCAVPRHACGDPAGSRSHRPTPSLQCGTGDATEYRWRCAPP